MQLRPTAAKTRLDPLTHPRCRVQGLRLWNSRPAKQPHSSHSRDAQTEAQSSPERVRSLMDADGKLVLSRALRTLEPVFRFIRGRGHG